MVGWTEMSLTECGCVERYVVVASLWTWRCVSGFINVEFHSCSNGSQFLKGGSVARSESLNQASCAQHPRLPSAETIRRYDVMSSCVPYQKPHVLSSFMSNISRCYTHLLKYTKLKHNGKLCPHSYQRRLDVFVQINHNRYVICWSCTFWWCGDLFRKVKRTRQ
jgi:hypothetical protein